MKQHFNKYLENAKAVKMTAEEKSKIFSNLNAIVSAAPEEASFSFVQLIRSPFSFESSTVKVSVMAALALFVLSGGISYAAHGSLPGDSLYAVKTNVNEKVAGFFLTNSTAKASYEATIAFRRLEEAEKLGAMGRLNADTKAELQGKFENHAKKLQINLDETDSKDADEAEKVATKFKFGLQAHRNILRQLAKEISDDNETEGHVSTLAEELGEDIHEDAEIKAIFKTGTSTDLSNKEEHREDIKKIEMQIRGSLHGLRNIHTGKEIELRGDDEQENNNHNDEHSSNNGGHSDGNQGHNGGGGASINAEGNIHVDLGGH